MAGNVWAEKLWLCTQERWGKKKCCTYVLSLWQQYLDNSCRMIHTDPLWFTVWLHFIWHQSKEDVSDDTIYNCEIRWILSPRPGERKGATVTSPEVFWNVERFSNQSAQSDCTKTLKKDAGLQERRKKKLKKRLGNNNVCTHGNSLIKAEEGGGVELHSLLWLLLTKLLLCAILQTDPMSNKAYRAPSSSVWKACAWRYRGCVLATATQGSNPTCGPTSLSHCPVDKAQKIYLSHFVDEQ